MVNFSTSTEQITVTEQIAIGHLDDGASMDHVCKTLVAIHGAAYTFRVARWQGGTELTMTPGRQRVYFVMEAEHAGVILSPSQRVRGVPLGEAYQPLQEQWGEVTTSVEEELWPGDVICLNDDQSQSVMPQSVRIVGIVTCFEVETEATAYPLPTVAFLRHLTDFPGGCAAYPGAFRREALPPVRALAGVLDQRGVNRVNEHTLDMRVDRHPRPQPHHHGPVTIGGGDVVNHSETALVLSRTRYALPPLQGQSDDTETGSVVIYHHAAANPADTRVVAVRPGSVLVTPATVDSIAGHCFENAFAMLVAIPGFVSPHNSI